MASTVNPHNRSEPHQRRPASRPLADANRRPTELTNTEARVQQLIAVIRSNVQHLDAIRQLYRLLSAGEPVAVERLAAEGDWSIDDLRAELARHPGTDWDEHGRVVGFGLTLRPTPHAFTFDAHTVYAFCADDALQFPIVLGRSGVIESPCPATGRRVRVEVTPRDVIGVDPPEAVVSKVSPTEAVADVRAEICGLGHFFSSREAAADWLAHYPQGQVIPVTGDFEIVRQAMTELGWAANQVEQAGP